MVVCWACRVSSSRVCAALPQGVAAAALQWGSVARINPTHATAIAATITSTRRSYVDSRCIFTCCWHGPGLYVRLYVLWAYTISSSAEATARRRCSASATTVCSRRQSRVMPL